MIIVDSSINLSSQRFSAEEYQKKESLNYWKTGENSRLNVNTEEMSRLTETNIALSESSVKVSLSSEAVKQSSTKEIESLQEEGLLSDLNIRILRDLVERMTGKKITLFSQPHSQNLKEGEAVNQESLKENDQGSAGFGLAYDLHETYYEAESTSFSASGVIQTADGKRVDFTLDLNMSREFYQENNVSLRMGDALKDPLVINFNGNAAQLRETKFSFDIDMDGYEDQISFVTPESGFLALDKNNDGVINDGGELFGAATGNGFDELSSFDEDMNGWIDENDSIYDRLQIWSKDENGKDHLIALGQKGIGAIYLENLDTLFSLKTDKNDLLGQVSASGVFLREDYSVGTIQKIDLVV